MLIKITSATLVKNIHHPDTILLDTELPDGNWPYTKKQLLKMTVAGDSGKEYMEKYFQDVPLNVVEV